MDTESGIETGDSDSATASVTSSECAAAAAAVSTTTSLRRDNPAVVSVDTLLTPDTTTSCPDDVEEFIRRMMVQPPPSPVYFDESDVAIVPSPTDVIDDSWNQLPPAANYSPYCVLPPLVELPEDDVTTSVMVLPSNYDCRPRTVPPPPPSSSVGEFTEPKPHPRNVCVNSCVDMLPDDVSACHERTVDENSNCVLVSAGGVVAGDKRHRPPLPARRHDRTMIANGVGHVDVADSQTSTTMEHATLTLPVSASDEKSARARVQSVPQPAHSRRFSGESEKFTNSRKKAPTANIWKRFLKRDVESGGMTSSTGFTWTLFPHRHSVTAQSLSVAESTATCPRRPKNLQAAQAKVAALAAAKARDMHISAPFDFRDLNDASQKPAQRTASDELQLNATDHREMNEDDVRPAGEESHKAENTVAPLPDDASAAANASSSSGISWALFRHRKSAILPSSSVAESTATLPRRPKILLTTSTQTKIAAMAAEKARNLQISAPFDFRDLTNVSEKLSLSTAPDVEQLNPTEVDQDGAHSTGQENNDKEEGSSESDDDLLDDESSETRATTTRYYRDEQGRLFNAAAVPLITKTSSFPCLSSVDDDDKRHSPKNVRHTVPTAGQSNHSPSSGRRISLMHISATLPRLYKRSQSSNDDHLSATQHRCDSPTTGQEPECTDDDVSEVTRSEYLQTSVTEAVRPSPAASTSQLLRRSMTEEPPPTPPLLGLLDPILNFDDDARPSETVTGRRLDTFRGALKPVRWSEDDPIPAGTRQVRSLSVGSVTSARQIPAYVDVRPPTMFLAATVTDVPPPAAAAPVAAPRSVKTSATRDKQRPDKPQKVKLG